MTAAIGSSGLGMSEMEVIDLISDTDGEEDLKFSSPMPDVMEEHGPSAECPDRQSDIGNVKSEVLSDSGDFRPKSFTHRFRMKAVSGDLALQICDEFEIVYTSCLDTLQNWIEALPADATLGFDTEGEGKVLQLCCLQRYTILIFVLPLNDHMATEKERCKTILSRVMTSSTHLKVGIAAFDDAYKVRHVAGLGTLEGIFDLTYLAGDLKINERGELARIFNKERSKGVVVIQENMENAANLSAGLKSLYKTLFESDFHNLEYQNTANESYVAAPIDCTKKGRRVGRWSRHPLQESDLAYAAKDALFGSLLYNNMITKFSESEVEQLVQQASLEYHKRTARRDAKAARTRNVVRKKLPNLKTAGLKTKKKVSGQNKNAKKITKTSKPVRSQGKKNKQTARSPKMTSNPSTAGRMMKREDSPIIRVKIED